MCRTSLENISAPIPARATSVTLYRGNLEVVEAFHYQAAYQTMDLKYPLPDWLKDRATVNGKTLDLETNSGSIAVKPGQWILRDRRGNLQILEAHEFHQNLSSADRMTH
jgi:hypothetical protein